MSQITNLMRHFARSSGQTLQAAVESLSNGSLSAFRQLQAKVEGLELTRFITTQVSSSDQAAESFANEAARATGLDFLKGVISIGAGGFILSELGAFAALLGTSALLPGLIAVALILYGISLALPAVWKRLMDRLDFPRLFAGAAE